jgi:hypothetical protein
VTVTADGTGKVDAGNLAASGDAAGGSVVVTGQYTPATSSASGKVKIIVIKTTGFSSGEFATLTCDLANGVAPNPADFSLSDFKPVDQNGAAIDGLVPTFTAELR